MSSSSSALLSIFAFSSSSLLSLAIDAWRPLSCCSHDCRSSLANWSMEATMLDQSRSSSAALREDEVLLLLLPLPLPAEDGAEDEEDDERL